MNSQCAFFFFFALFFLVFSLSLFLSLSLFFVTCPSVQQMQEARSLQKQSKDSICSREREFTKYRRCFPLSCLVYVHLIQVLSRWAVQHLESIPQCGEKTIVSIAKPFTKDSSSLSVVSAEVSSSSSSSFRPSFSRSSLGRKSPRERFSS